MVRSYLKNNVDPEKFISGQYLREWFSLSASPSIALRCVVRIERQMDMGCREEMVDDITTQGLPPASGTTAGTNGPSSELVEEIVSESSSTGDYHCLSLCLSHKQLNASSWCVYVT